MQWLTTLDPTLLWGSVGTFTLLIIILLALRSRGRQRRLAAAPHLAINSFQIAPLGRDAFVKLINQGESATLSRLQVKGRYDITVKNEIAGQVLHRGGTYSILLEATAQQRLEPDFTLCLTFVDAGGQIYEQTFGLAPPQTLGIKRTKRR